MPPDYGLPPSRERRMPGPQRKRACQPECPAQTLSFCFLFGYCYDGARKHGAVQQATTLSALVVFVALTASFSVLLRSTATGSATAGLTAARRGRIGIRTLRSRLARCVVLVALTAGFYVLLMGTALVARTRTGVIARLLAALVAARTRARLVARLLAIRTRARLVTRLLVTRLLIAALVLLIRVHVHSFLKLGCCARRFSS